MHFFNALPKVSFFPVKNNDLFYLVIAALGQTIELRLNTAYQKVKKTVFLPDCCKQ